MPDFRSSGATIHYIDEGAGPPILLIHGFASNLEGNWRATGVMAALTKAGRRAIAIDNRGHGKSDKPHDPAAYGIKTMAGDAIALLDHLGIAKADLMGYSMGGYISCVLITEHQSRFNSAIIGGAGERVLGKQFDDLATGAIADALAGVKGSTGNPIARQFLTFAQALSGNDLQALAAVMRSGRPSVDPSKLSSVRIPVLVIAGQNDPLVGNVKRFADAIPGSQLVMLPGDHLTVFVGNGYRDTALKFLAAQSPVPAA